MTAQDPAAFEKLCANTIRFLAVDGVQKANSGHPGMPMEAAPLASLLWGEVMRFDPGDAGWPNRDRFVLSAGHGSMLLYAMIHLTGQGLSLEDLKNFRQLGSPTPGHPEFGEVPAAETTTGPLGQGFGAAVGMAMAQRFLAHKFNRPGFDLIDHHVYTVAGDGCMMEGVTSEAASLAGHLGLGKLICIYLDNRITIEGPTGLAFTEDVAARFEAYGWQVLRCQGGDLAAAREAISQAQAQGDKPSLIIARTHIACGSPNKQDTADAHGAPLGEEEVRLTKDNCAWVSHEPFHVPPEVAEHFARAGQRGKAAADEWRAMYARYQAEHPELASQWEAMAQAPDLAAIAGDLPNFNPGDKIATRKASGQALAALAPHLPGLIGGSADLAPSNNTWLKDLGEFKAEFGPNIHFGVREHAMGAILNGLAHSGRLIPYGGTFLVFSDYMRPSMRLAAMMGLQVIYVFTHDSIGLGEDGPTHQPIEHLASLRAMPNLTAIRPADASETVEAWKAALAIRTGPTALVLSRQGLPVLDRSALASAGELAKGAYVLSEAAGGAPEMIMAASGAEVHLALAAQQRLQSEGVAARVVNVASWELFEAQPAAYQEEVFPAAVTRRIGVEAGSVQGWERYLCGQAPFIGMSTFGASAPAGQLFERFGFTVDNLVAKAKELVA